MDSRMQALLLKKEESILEREALIKHMENRQRELEFEKEDEANRKKEREREINEQVCCFQIVMTNLCIFCKVIQNQEDDKENHDAFSELSVI